MRITCFSARNVYMYKNIYKNTCVQYTKKAEKGIPKGNACMKLQGLQSLQSVTRESFVDLSVGPIYTHLYQDLEV